MINYQTTSGSPESTKLVVSRAARIVSLVVTNVGSATRYLYAFDNAAASGALACPPIAIAPGATVAISDLVLATGLYIASSTTAATYTAAGGADFSVNVQGNEL